MTGKTNEKRDKKAPVMTVNVQYTYNVIAFGIVALQGRRAP